MPADTQVRGVMDDQLSRRKFIGWASRGVAASAVGLPLLLEACAPSPPPAAPTSPPAPKSAAAPASGGGATVGGVKLPTYAPFAGPQADLPGNPQGLDPAYYKFPSKLT